MSYFLFFRSKIRDAQCNFCVPFNRKTRIFIQDEGIEKVLIKLRFTSLCLRAYKCRSTGRNKLSLNGCTVGQNNQECRLEYWATHSYIRSFIRIGHSFACSTLLASLARSAVLAHFAHSEANVKVNDWMAIYSEFFFLFWPTAHLCA